MPRLSYVVLAAFISGSAIIVPAAPAQERTFDVVSVKKNAELDISPLFDLRGVPGGRVTIRAMSLLTIIQFVYPEFRRSHQVEGGPGWLASDRFDIQATFEAGTVPAINRTTMEVPASLLTMLRAMLADRFKLKVRTETKEIPIYALVLARKDGQLGAQLKRSAIDCATPGPSLSEKCGMRTDMTTFVLTAVGVNMDILASWLDLRLRTESGRFERSGRPVENMTGLTGAFDFTLDQRRGPDAPSIFTTIQENFGLRLEPRTGTANIIVIEHVEQPTPN